MKVYIHKITHTRTLIVVLFIMLKLEIMQIPTKRNVDKRNVVHSCNEILLCNKME